MQHTAPRQASTRSKRSHQGLPRRSRQAKAGWSPERRARQAELIRRWAPWRRSTGPKTDAGKTRCAMNALKHGYRSQAGIQRLQRVRQAIRLAARTLELVKLHDRIRNSRRRIKYRFPPPHAFRSYESLATLIARFDRLTSPSAATDQPSNTQTHLPLAVSGLPCRSPKGAKAGGGNAEIRNPRGRSRPVSASWP